MIPRSLRERIGLKAGGEVDIVLDGAGIRIEPVAGAGFVEEDGRLIIPASGRAIDDAAVRALRDADQR